MSCWSWMVCFFSHLPAWHWNTSLCSALSLYAATTDKSSPIPLEQRIKVREFVEDLITSLLGGPVDDVSVGQLFKNLDCKCDSGANLFYFFCHIVIANWYLFVITVAGRRHLFYCVVAETMRSLTHRHINQFYSFINIALGKYIWFNLNANQFRMLSVDTFDWSGRWILGWTVESFTKMKRLLLLERVIQNSSIPMKQNSEYIATKTSAEV